MSAPGAPGPYVEVNECKVFASGAGATRWAWFRIHGRRPVVDVKVSLGGNLVHLPCADLAAADELAEVLVEVGLPRSAVKVRAGRRRRPYAVGMTWKVSSESDPARWVQYDGTGWTADPTSDDYMRAGVGQPVPLAPMSETYTPTGAGDEVGLFLLARAVVPAPHHVVGIIPATPEPAAHSERVDY